MDQLIAAYGVDGLTKCVLSLGHLVGLTLGLGTTLFLDGGCVLSIVNRSWGGYRAFMSGALFACATRFITVGLAILWITGIGFLVHYAVFSPDKLANPKIYAKLALVSVLTVNGGLLHACVLPRVAVMDDPQAMMASPVGRLCLLSGSVSAASWIGAFLLGALPVLNNVVSATLLLLVWAVLVVLVFVCARAVLALHGRQGAAPQSRCQAAGSEIGSARSTS